ncbi:MAG: response regulator [Bacteroidia bacterium]
MTQKIKVAVVDDQTLFRDGLISLLEEIENCEIIIEADDGKTLVDILKTEQQPDVILLDYEMPVMNGVQTAAYLKQYYPGIKILILTMYDDDSLVYDTILQGAHGFLLKDSKIEEIVEAIEVVTTTGYYFNKFVSIEMIAKLLQGNLIDPHYKETKLSDREVEVIRMICKEYTPKEISEKLFLSLKTVNRHRENMLEKTGAQTTAGLVVYAIKNNLYKIR